MKKIKLLPSIIMLALCLAVIGIGVYSATTGSNTISGMLTVNSAGHEVDIAVYQATESGATGARQIDTKFSTHMYGKLIGSTTGSRAGKPISLSDIAFNSDAANTFVDVDMIDLIIAVTNKSSEDVGVYFWDKGEATVAPVTATIDTTVNWYDGEPYIESVTVGDSDILYGHQNMYADTDTGKTTAIADAEYSFYHHIPSVYTLTGSDSATAYGEYTDSDGKRYYTEYLHVYLRLKEAVFTSQSAEISLSMNLNVEKYVPTTNYTTTDGFVKIAKGITPSSVSQGATHIVYPYGFTGNVGIGGRYLYAISVPSGTTGFGISDNESMLESLILPNSITNIFQTSWLFYLQKMANVY